MSNKYAQSTVSSETHFTRAPMGEIEFSKMSSNPIHLTTFNGGDIVPIWCEEVLPHDTFKCDLDFVIRQATSAVPVMGQLVVDFYAFFVPNRVVNDSWKNVMGENTSGAWTAPEVSLAPLYPTSSSERFVTVPVGSVADYYGFPTQRPIPTAILKQCNDLKFCGYVSCFNHYFRSQNFTPEIPLSKLNVFKGFFSPVNSDIGALAVPAGTKADGSYFAGAYQKAIGGEGSVSTDTTIIGSRKTTFSALGRPLKANKLHDYFTSVLPSPQRGRTVTIGQTGFVPLDSSPTLTRLSSAVRFGTDSGSSYQNPSAIGSKYIPLGLSSFAWDTTSNVNAYKMVYNPKEVYDLKGTSSQSASSDSVDLIATNLGLNLGDLAISIDDLRLSAAMQTAYEVLGRGGSRYIEFINSFFGLEIDNPFDDIPTLLGHFRRDLDLYQTAQTSATPSGDGTPQGNLSAWGYTNSGGNMFHYTFKEHGYLHIFCVVRHRNVYPSFLSRDNFRLSMFDFYSYPFANISEQPVYTREINPFLSNSDGVFGYQEAWAEYRMSPDRVSGYMRPYKYGENNANDLGYWNYADYLEPTLEIANTDWLQSNTAEIVERSTAGLDKTLPQFKGQFMFKFVKERPMPVYSVPGIDIF